MEQHAESIAYGVVRTDGHGIPVESFAVTGAPGAWVLTSSPVTADVPPTTRSEATLTDLISALPALHEVRPREFTQFTCESLPTVELCDRLVVVDPEHLDETEGHWDEHPGTWLFEELDWGTLNGLGSRPVSLNDEPLVCASVGDSAVVVPFDVDAWRPRPLFERLWGSCGITVLGSMTSGYDDFRIGQVTPRVAMSAVRMEDLENACEAWFVDADDPSHRVRRTIAWFRTVLGIWSFDPSTADRLVRSYLDGGQNAYQRALEQEWSDDVESELFLLLEPGDEDVYRAALSRGAPML